MSLENGDRTLEPEDAFYFVKFDQDKKKMTDISNNWKCMLFH